MEFLHNKRIIIDCGTQQWRWPIEGPAPILQTAKQFARSLRKEAHVYAIVVSNVVESAPEATTSRTLGVSEEYLKRRIRSDFANIFLKEKGG